MKQMRNLFLKQQQAVVKANHDTVFAVSNGRECHPFCTGIKEQNQVKLLSLDKTNVAVSDFFMLLKMPVFIYNSFLQGPALGHIGCAVYGFMGGLTGTSSIMTLAAIAVDRYLVLSRPLDFNRKITNVRAIFTILTVWIYSCIFAMLPLLGVGRYVPEGYLTSCSFDYLATDIRTRIFILIFFAGAWLVPYFIISYCYGALLRSVFRTRKNISSNEKHPQHYRNGQGHSPRIEWTIAKIVLGIVVLWLIAWTPYAVVALIGISGNGHVITPFISMIPALFCKSSACINPFIYALTHPKIKKELNLRVRRFFLPSADSKQEFQWKTEQTTKALNRPISGQNIVKLSNHHGGNRSSFSSAASSLDMRRATQDLHEFCLVSNQFVHIESENQRLASMLLKVSDHDKDNYEDVCPRNCSKNCLGSVQLLTNVLIPRKDGESLAKLHNFHIANGQSD